ncbi:hypothetical protein IT400_04240 [Candidatus Nomurabacteria bacterium]|nr:hypothetical protein [Candidatus Nomurabacteria bacterium]
MKRISQLHMSAVLFSTVLILSFITTKAQEIPKEKGLEKVTLGATWAPAMVVTSTDFHFSEEYTLCAAVNAFTKNWNGHILYSPYQQKLQTLQGFKIRSSPTVDLFFFYEKDFKEKADYASVGIQRLCQLGDCEDFFTLFTEIGTDFESPILKVGFTISPQFILWKK